MKYLPFEIKKEIFSYLEFKCKNCKNCKKLIINPKYDNFCTINCYTYYYSIINLNELFYISYIFLIVLLNFFNEYILLLNTNCSSISILQNCNYLYYYFGIINYTNFFTFFILIPVYCLSSREKKYGHFEY